MRDNLKVLTSAEPPIHPSARRSPTKARAVKPRRPCVEASLLMSIDEVSKELKLSRSTIDELVSAGKVPVVRVGRAVRVPRRALVEWLASEAGVSASSIQAPPPVESEAQKAHAANVQRAVAAGIAPDVASLMAGRFQFPANFHVGS